MKIKYVLSTLTLCICATSGLEAQSWRNDLKDFLINNQRDLRTDASVDFASASHHEAFDMIQGYLRDSTFEVRLKALELTHHVAIASGDARSRQRGVDLLLSSLQDLDLTGRVLSMLTDFRRDDFSENARAVIGQQVEQKSTYLNELMRIAGYLQLTNLRSTLVKYSTPGNTGATRWAALLSLARMGDAPATSEIMTRVERLPVNDDVVYNIFPDLVFTRQTRPVAYLVEAMQRNEKNCFTADAERETPIPCTYRIAEQLAAIIEGFPLTVDETGDLETTDYAAASESLKKWIGAHPRYKILDEKY